MSIIISSLHRWAFSGSRYSNDSKPSHGYECELKLLTCDAKQVSRKCMENAVIDSRLQNLQLFPCRTSSGNNSIEARVTQAEEALYCDQGCLTQRYQSGHTTLKRMTSCF